MSFFDSIPQPPPPPEPVRRPRPAWVQPDAVIPGAVPAELLLIRTERVAVAVGGVRAYPNGFEFMLHVHRRGDDETEPGWHDPLDRRGGRGRQVPNDVLRLGLMYADGRRAATPGRYWRPHDDTDPGRLVLHQDGSSGSARRWDGRFWVHPLPPEGPVTFVASWLQYGVAETRAKLDGAMIREAAGRAVILWPEEPEPEYGADHAWSSQIAMAGKQDEPGAGVKPGEGPVR